MGSLDVGINIDEAAVENPDLLRDSLQDAFGELVALAPAPQATSSPTAPADGRKPRWRDRLRRLS